MICCCPCHNILLEPEPESTPLLPGAAPLSSGAAGWEPAPTLFCSSFSSLLGWTRGQVIIPSSRPDESGCFCTDSLCFGVWETLPYVFLPSLFSDLPQPISTPSLLDPQLAGRVPLPSVPLPSSVHGTECLAAPCMSGAGSFWTGERLPFTFTCARAGGDSGDSPLVWVRSSFSLGTVDIWGSIFVCREGHSCVLCPSLTRCSQPFLSPHSRPR